MRIGETVTTMLTSDEPTMSEILMNTPLSSGCGSSRVFTYTTVLRASWSDEREALGSFPVYSSSTDRVRRSILADTFGVEETSNDSPQVRVQRMSSWLRVELQKYSSA